MSKYFTDNQRVGELVVPELNHTWDFCNQCGWHVKCANCGNNCCNGGSGDGCPDKCAEAYHLQDEFEQELTP